MAKNLKLKGSLRTKVGGEGSSSDSSSDDGYPTTHLPSPSFFTELPIAGKQGGVKLFFKPGLCTEAVKEGLEQALKHESTVAEIDLACAVKIDWDAISPILLQHLIKEDLISVIVPPLKVSLVKGKCRGRILEELRTQVGNKVTIYKQEFRSQYFLNTEFFTDKIRVNIKEGDAGETKDKFKDLVSFLNEVADAKPQYMIESQEFRNAIMRAYRTMKRYGKNMKAQKRKLDEEDIKDEGKMGYPITLP